MWISGLIAGLLTIFGILVILFFKYCVSDYEKPQNIPPEAIQKGNNKESFWIYEFPNEDPDMMHLQIFNDYNGEMAFEADFERNGNQCIDSISYFDPCLPAIYLTDGQKCKVVKTYGGYLLEHLIEECSIHELPAQDPDIMHLQIFNGSDGEMAFEADFERNGNQCIDSISYFDPVLRLIYLKNGQKCKVIKTYGGYLLKYEIEDYSIHELPAQDPDIMHLQIFNDYYGEMAFEADFERKGNQCIDSISYFDPFPPAIYLADGQKCKVLKVYDGYLLDQIKKYYSDGLPIDSI